MLDKKEILASVVRWSAQYSPINPIEPKQIKDEMERLAKQMNADDLPVFIDALFSVERNNLDVFMEFAFYYVKENVDSISKQLINHLQPNGPWQILELIGYTKKQNLYFDMIKVIDYDHLDQKAKLSLIFAINLLRNKHALDFLRNKKEKEIDPEIIEEIDFAYENINRS